MIYTEDLQASLDIDWFAIDCLGNIAHFASGGGRLPITIANYKEDTELLASYFRALQPISNTFISEQARIITEGMSTYDLGRYLADFKLMASKGIYSYDKSKPSNFLDPNYHLVMRPNVKLSLRNLPRQIYEVIIRTNFTDEFENLDTIIVS